MKAPGAVMTRARALSPPQDHAPRAAASVVAPPPLPTTFSLTGVALGVELGADTTRTVRLSGVTARLYRIKSADGTPVTETLVATDVADANGEFMFSSLASAYYRIDVAAPGGGPYVDGSVSLAPPSATEIRVHVVLHRKS
jgi:hypothetical protein